MLQFKISRDTFYLQTCKILSFKLELELQIVQQTRLLVFVAKEQYIQFTVTLTNALLLHWLPDSTKLVWKDELAFSVYHVNICFQTKERKAAATIYMQTKTGIP